MFACPADSDEMGLGKTVQAIALLSALYEHVRNRRAAAGDAPTAGGVESGPHLIVVPKTTLGNWEREFSQWAPGLAVVTYSGLEQERSATRSARWYVTDELSGQVVRSPASSGTYVGLYPHVAFVSLVPTAYVYLGLLLAHAAVACSAGCAVDLL